jgi:hypothetical protein
LKIVITHFTFIKSNVSYISNQWFSTWVMYTPGVREQ